MLIRLLRERLRPYTRPLLLVVVLLPSVKAKREEAFVED